MTEYEKMEKGLLYDPLDEAIMKEQQSYQDRLWSFNQLKPADFAAKEAFLKENFAECGEGCYIELPFHANWGGHHVHFGSYIYANSNLTLVDDGHIYVGDHVMIGPNVTIATANHPLEPEPRAKGWQINSDVRIGENVWLGAGVIIVPGVTIGKNTVIGAGSIVTKDIPDNVLAVGNPCRVIREIGTDSNSKKTHREDVMFDILTIGEMLIDLTQTGVSDTGIPVYTAFPGGAPANVAVAAAKLGAKTAFIGKVGNDAFGRLLVDTVKQHGVNADNMIVSEKANTTLAVVSLQESGERDFAFYRRGFADTLLSESEIPDTVLKDTHILHFGSVSMTEEPSRTATFHSALRAKNMGATITYDPNYRASLWDSLDEALLQMKMPLSIVDILKISDEELPLLTDTDDPEAGTKLLADRYGIPLILLTLGAKGSYYRAGELTGLCEGVQVKVADTNGAGDTFFGAFLSGMARLGKYKPAELTEDEIKELVGFANKAASITTSRSGAIPAMPTLDEVM